MSFTLLPKVMSVRLLQPKKILIAEIQLSALNAAEVKPEQLRKAKSPIEVTLLGMVTEVRPLHPIHKYDGI